jgi:hypothetical protein
MQHRFFPASSSQSREFEDDTAARMARRCVTEFNRTAVETSSRVADETTMGHSTAAAASESVQNGLFPNAGRMRQFEDHAAFLAIGSATTSRGRTV